MLNMNVLNGSMPSSANAASAVKTRHQPLFAEHTARFVYADAPKLVYWEATQSCALACVHCRAESMPTRSPFELSTTEACALLEQIADFGSEPAPHLVITGGDPLRRPDLFSLIAYGKRLGLSISVTPAGTRDVTPEVVRHFADAGVDSLALSLDGSTPARHDAFRGVAGSFAWTLAGARMIVEAGIPLQINSMVTAQTLDDIPHVYATVRELGITRWALFFLIATGRGSALAEITPEESERLLVWLGQVARDPETRFIIKTTEAHHYRRIAVQALRRRLPETQMLDLPVGRGFGIRDGNGIVFVSHAGQVLPQRLSAGERGQCAHRALGRHLSSQPAFPGAAQRGQHYRQVRSLRFSHPLRRFARPRLRCHGRSAGQRSALPLPTAGHCLAECSGSTAAGESSVAILERIQLPAPVGNEGQQRRKDQILHHVLDFAPSDMPAGGAEHDEDQAERSQRRQPGLNAEETGQEKTQPAQNFENPANHMQTGSEFVHPGHLGREVGRQDKMLHADEEKE